MTGFTNIRTQKSKYSLCFGSPTTEAVGSDIHKTFGTNGFSRWSTNLYQASNSKDLTFDTPTKFDNPFWMTTLQ